MTTHCSLIMMTLFGIDVPQSPRGDKIRSAPVEMDDTPCILAETTYQLVLDLFHQKDEKVVCDQDYELANRF